MCSELARMVFQFVSELKSPFENFMITLCLFYNAVLYKIHKAIATLQELCVGFLLYITQLWSSEEELWLGKSLLYSTTLL